MDAKIIDFYNEGNSMVATCRKFHSTPKVLKEIFSQNNVYIRNQKEQLIIENIKRTKRINHNFFSELNNINSYYLGFIAADGTVRKNRNEIKIGLSAVDKNFLEEMKDNFNSEQTIKTYFTNNGFECCEFCFSSFQIKMDLLKYGICPNKTLIGLNLNKIPKEFQLPFIKGFFDGDGSFSYNKQTKQAKTSFASHTIGILQQIKDFFQNGNIYQDKRTNVYYLEFSTLPSLKIMEEFYSIDTPFLERKKQKYLECLELRNNIPRDKAPQAEDEKLC